MNKKLCSSNDNNTTNYSVNNIETVEKLSNEMRTSFFSLPFKFFKYLTLNIDFVDIFSDIIYGLFEQIN